MPESQEEIKKEVVDRLRWDTRLDASDIEVEVLDGKVKLDGTVPTYTALRAAESDSVQVPGIKSVENNLTVQYPPAIDVPEDAEIRLNIERALYFNLDVESREISVSVDAGRVKLDGSVDSYWKKRSVEDLVSNMRGVSFITNNLAVVPTRNISDHIIADDIISTLKRNIHVVAANVDVKVDNGVVTLTGTVPSWAAYWAAQDAARFAFGVIEIINRLKVSSPGMTADVR